MPYQLSSATRDRIALLLVSDIRELLGQIKVCGFDRTSSEHLSRMMSDLQALLEARTAQE